MDVLAVVCWDGGLLSGYASIADSARESGSIAIGSKTLANLEIVRDNGVEGGTAYKNASNPRAKTVVALADYYGVSTDYILGITEYDSPDISVVELGRRLGLSNEATDRLGEICNSQLLDTLNKVLSCNEFTYILWILEECIHLSDRLISIGTSSKMQDMTRNASESLFIYSSCEGALSRRKHIREHPEYKEILDDNIIHTEIKVGSEHLDYRVQRLMHQFESMVSKLARIEDAHNADRYNTIDREAVLKAQRYEIDMILDEIMYPESEESILADLEELNKDVDDGGEGADCQSSGNDDDSSDNT